MVRQLDTDTAKDDTASAPQRLHSLQPYLFVILECDRPTAGGARYSLSHVDQVVIGRGTERGGLHRTLSGVRRLFISLPAQSLSSSHARIFRDGSRWVFEDAQSKNGSLVNGEAATRVLLEDGAFIEVGHTILLFRAALPTPAGTSQILDLTGTDGADPTKTLLPELAHQFTELGKIARGKLPVVLVGPTGTGKELVARSIHETSGRSGDFIAFNCGALTPNLIESQLFGHARGAFSGAVRDEPGFLRRADGGTLLLDEVGDLSPSAQLALLRVLQEGEVVAVGTSRPVQVDIRIVAASHDPLEALVKRGHFRPDLLGRLEGFTLELPTLGRRREDFGVILASLLRKTVLNTEIVPIKPAAGRALCFYEWPLNVRELEQSMLRALALADGSAIGTNHLPAKIAAAFDRPLGASSIEQSGVGILKDDAVIRVELLKYLEEHQGNVSKVAEAMGKARAQIHRWMKRFGIDPDVFRRPA